MPPRELEQSGRDLHTLLQRVHRPGGVKETFGLVEKAKQKFAIISQKFRFGLRSFDCPPLTLQGAGWEAGRSGGPLEVFSPLDQHRQLAQLPGQVRHRGTLTGV